MLSRRTRVTLLGLGSCTRPLLALRPPLLVTFGCPMVGDSAFVAMQNAMVAPCGGLRVFNHLDPIPSVGRGFVAPWQELLGLRVGARAATPANAQADAEGSSGGSGVGGGVDGSRGGETRAEAEEAAGKSGQSVHGGLPVTLRNDPLTTLNPMANHLQYVCDSVETFTGDPVARAKYMLPGMIYQPDTATRPPAPMPRREVGGGAAAAAGASSWRERAGRDDGADGYVFGDVSRSMMRSLRDTLENGRQQFELVRLHANKGKGRDAAHADEE